MSCKDMDRLIQLYLDQEIDEADLTCLREHIKTCESCRQSLQEMMALMQTLEEIRGNQEDSRISAVNQMIKWMAVATSVVFIILFVPPLQNHDQIASDVPGASPEPVATQEAEELPVESEVMVLATGSESLPIPDNDYIRVVRPRDDDEESMVDSEFQADTAWVYPSAIPFVLQGKMDWHKELKRFVFVGVPDSETLQTLLASMGLSSDTGDSHMIEDPSFPTSVILTTGNDPHLETFTFPENEGNISRWFDKLAATPALP